MAMNRLISEVKEVIECGSVKEANIYLDKGWILLDCLVMTQLCYKIVTVGPNSFEKIQPFDKLITIYIVGRTEAEQ